MEFRILGPLEVSAGDGAIKLGGHKQRAVLAHLIVRANRPVPVDLLIDGLWGEEPPETARNTLQTYVYRLRQGLGGERNSREAGGCSGGAHVGPPGGRASTCSERMPPRSTPCGSRSWSRPPRPISRPNSPRPPPRSRRHSLSGAAHHLPTCRTS